MVDAPTEISPMQELSEKFKIHHKPLVLVLIVALVLLIGWLRFLTGPEFAFSFLYLLPIITATWLVSLSWGVLISVVSAISWLLADMAMIDRFSHAYIPLVNESFRLTVFLFIVYVIARHKKILETQKELAMLDPLTKAANRRAFLQLAGTEIDRSRRYHHPFSVMVIDVDDFKPINDQFGHHTGDQLLITVVETIKQHVRAIDIVARFGGDEFVVLLVKTEETSAALIAEKLHKQLLAVMQHHRWPVTFSMGVVTCHSVPDSIDETIRAADALMYRVKHNGKNNIRHTVLKT